MKLVLIILIAALPVYGAPVLEGYLDVRPSWAASEGTFHMENEVGAAYRFTRRTSVGYTQEFRYNLKGYPDDFALRYGYFRAEFANVATAGIATVTLEPRLYLPTKPEDRVAGMRLALRPIAKVTLNLGSGVAFEFWESPILPWYQDAGYAEADEEYIANRAFENRIEMGPTVSLWEGAVTIKAPLVYQAILHRKFRGDARDDGRWTHTAWITPEVMWWPGDNTGVGISYYSDSLMGPGTRVADGLKKGVFQIAFQQSF